MARGAYRYQRLRVLWRQYRWAVTGMTVAAALVLGVIGFGKYGKPQPFLDELYRTVSLFSFNQNLTPPMPPALEVARWLAPLAVAYAGFRVLAAIFAEQWVRFRVRVMFRHHVLVVGLGACGMRLASNFRQRGDRIVAVDRNPTEAAVTTCAEQGILLVRGDAADPVVLTRAGLKTAGLTLVVCGDEGTNADIAGLITHLSQRRRSAQRVLVRISDSDLSQLLEQAALATPGAPGRRLEFFNVNRLGPRALLDTWQPRSEINGRPFSIVVAGSGPLATSLVIEAARRWRLEHRGTSERIRITLVAADAATLAAALQTRLPALGRSADLATLAADPADPAAPPIPLPPLETADGRPGGRQPDIAFACLETDADNVQAAIRLRRVLPDSVPVVACAAGAAGSSLITMLDRSVGGYLANMHGFSLLDQICRPEVILNLDREIFARAAHRDYVRRRLAAGADPAGDPALAAWGDLPEDLRESNRAQVADIPAKLDAIGYEFAPTDDWDANLFRFTSEQVEKLSRIEHERYVKERQRAGYRYGPVRDPAAKISPYLVPWEQLSEDVQDLDRDAVRLIPSILAAAGYAIVSQRPRTPPPATGTAGTQDSGSPQQASTSGRPHMVIGAPSGRDDLRDAQDP